MRKDYVAKRGEWLSCRSLETGVVEAMGIEKGQEAIMGALIFKTGTFTRD